ncbi:MAG: hypothetical protein ACRECT_01360 [Thermoplasmata archaeon]
MPEPTPPVPLSFIIVTFGAATVVAVAIFYFGVRGMIGGPIP